MNLLQRLQSPGPKRILALDGGGIRGAITIEFLSEIEAHLRRRHNNPTLKLSDYFDLIGGTSTGAILAAGLATGLDTRELRELYAGLGGTIFAQKRWRARLPLVGSLVGAKLSSVPLEKQLVRIIGNRTLGDPNIPTGLCVIARRVDTSSTWPLLNHPLGRYFPDNRDMPLARVVRASTAAPLYFLPEELDVGRGQRGAFVDGGVSMANNPALQLFMIATLSGFHLRWPTGAKNLLLVSVGTGTWSRREPVTTVMNPRIDQVAARTVGGLMDDASWQNQLVLQALSDTPTPWVIDSEVGSAAGQLGKTPLLTYVRYNVELEPAALSDLGLADLASVATELHGMDKGSWSDELARVGEAAAGRDVRGEHFPAAFDLEPGVIESRRRMQAVDLSQFVQKTLAVSDPALRNLLITQFYYNVSSALATRIGGQNATWFAFGAWASRVAGTFIRGSALPDLVTAVASGQSPLPARLESAVQEFFSDSSNCMAEGNLLVFEELGPIAAKFVKALEEGPYALASAIDDIPSSEATGRGLRKAFTAYAQAAAATEPRSRAQFVLAGNLLTVHHEQQRLQPLLARAMSLPGFGTFGGLLAGRAMNHWRRLVTRFFIQYDLPGSSFRTNKDVTSVFPYAAFPRDLEELEVTSAAETWAELCGDMEGTRGSAVGDWSNLADRMGFIAALFRARQQDTGLLSPPFTRAESEELHAFKLPQTYVSSGL